MSNSIDPPLAIGIPDGITAEDVRDAIAALRDQTVQHQFRDSTEYDLIEDGVAYPPKAVLGLAARRILGRVLTPAEFSGGESSKCFAVLKNLGFTIVPKAAAPEPRAYLPVVGSLAVWLENTKSAHLHGGPGWEYGTCLWSPSRAKDGRESYKSMRLVVADDLVLHSCDGALTGLSRTIGPYREVQQQPPSPGQWAGMAPYYRIDLTGYKEFRRPMPLKELFRLFGGEIKDEIGSNRIPGYPFTLNDLTGKLSQRQTYLSRLTPQLYKVIQSAVQFETAVPNLPLQPLAVPPGASPERRRRFWVVSPGEDGFLWNEFQERKIVAIGWDELGPLDQYPDRESVTIALRAHRAEGAPNPIMSSLACYQFVREMNLGDYVIAKIGRSKLLGVGVVRSEYRYDSNRTQYRNVRDVQWLKAANLDLPEELWVATKALRACWENSLESVDRSRVLSGA